MSMRIHKIRLLIGCVIIGALVGFGLYAWLTQYYFPVRDVAPIVNLLEKGDLLGAQRLISGVCLTPDGRVETVPGDAPGMFKTRKDPNRIRIRGRGADKVKHAILMILNSSEDVNVLQGALSCAIIGAYNRNVLFDKQSEREILEKAVARYNAQIPAWAPELPWSVTAGSDGYYYVQMGGSRSH
ncbi:MAG: hypothetical protein FJ222_11175 [Lentisphaerae bacterium]|nr:hypothetical protein [Lentisphaerota bacterium]